jgi:hypothetical protein
MPRPSSVRTATSHVYPDTVTHQRDASLAPPQMPTSEDINKQIRASLGLPPKPEKHPTVPVEGHVCDFPLWSYSKKRSSVTQLHIDYEDGSFVTLKSPEGMPSPSWPGYLDVVLFFGQRDLFEQGYIEMSVYRMFQTLGIEPSDGRNYAHFRRDMDCAFYLGIETDRFRHPQTGLRSHVKYFRILRSMDLAKSRRETSTFCFETLFLQSLRAGYLKRLDWDFCLWLDKQTKALTRFFYGHLLKRIGEKSVYVRALQGFLRDCGLAHIADLDVKRRNQGLRETVFPALDLLKGQAIHTYELDDQGNMCFIRVRV